jgi:hypothetical protein
MEVERASLTFSSDICLEGPYRNSAKPQSINIVLLAGLLTELGL